MKRERTAERTAAQREVVQAIARADAAKAAAAKAAVAKAAEAKVQSHGIWQDLNADIKRLQRLQHQPRREDSCYKHHLRVLLQLKSYTKENLKKIHRNNKSATKKKLKQNQDEQWLAAQIVLSRQKYLEPNKQPVMDAAESIEDYMRVRESGYNGMKEIIYKEGHRQARTHLELVLNYYSLLI